MPRLVLSLSCLALLVASCNDTNDSQTYTSSLAKPTVKIFPVLDSTQSECEWSLSEEFTTAILSNLTQRNHLHLVSAKEKQLKQNTNPFAPDISWMKGAFPQ